MNSITLLPIPPSSTSDKILLIKALRDLKKLSLRDAKEIVDDLSMGVEYTFSSSDPASFVRAMLPSFCEFRFQEAHGGTFVLIDGSHHYGVMVRETLGEVAELVTQVRTDESYHGFVPLTSVEGKSILLDESYVIGMESQC